MKTFGLATSWIAGMLVYAYITGTWERALFSAYNIALFSGLIYVFVERENDERR